MIPRKFLFQIGLPLFVSGLITAGAYQVDSQMAQTRRANLGLFLGRQIASQVQVLALNARDRQEPNPLAWAIQSLSISPEPRLVQLALLEGGKPTDTEGEKYRFNEKSGNFSYLKVLESQTGAGVKVQIHLGYLGFMGAMTSWVSDLWALLLFCALFFFLRKLMVHLQVVPVCLPTKNNSHYRILVDQAVTSWMEQARTGIKVLSLHLKQVIQQAHQLVSSASQSRNQIESFVQMSPDLPESTRQILLSAIQSYDEVFQVTQDLNQHISSTTQSVLEESKLIQELQTKISQIDLKD